ncbi:MAG: hypothetical protein ACM3SQ_03765 [Betaproteobacteria bacterium]
MAENSRAVVAALIGAAIGALAGYVLFTERGRQWRRQLEPSLDQLARELNHLRGTVNKAAGLAAEGWNLLNEAAGEGGSIRGRSAEEGERRHGRRIRSL